MQEAFDWRKRCLRRWTNVKSAFDRPCQRSIDGLAEPGELTAGEAGLHAGLPNPDNATRSALRGALASLDCLRGARTLVKLEGGTLADSQEPSIAYASLNLLEQ